jgi:O-antigen ligase
VLCVGSLLLRREPLAGFTRGRWLAPLMVLAFLLWGALRLVTSLHYPILDVVRDSALSYYALFALIAYALGNVDRRFTPTGLLEVYGRFVPYMIVIAPVRLIFSTIPSLKALPPTIPGSDVPLLGGHRPGNLGVQVAIAVVYLASTGRRDRATVAGIVTGVLTILLVATQSRGGFLAAMTVIGLAMLLWGRRLRFRWTAAAGVLIALMIVAWGLNLSISSGERNFSPTQLFANVESLVSNDPSSSSQLSDTENFRSVLWTRVLDATVRTDQLENGWGFGPNLGSTFLPTHEDKALRNPHNSHLTVLARLGIVGALIWAVLLLSWFGGVLRLARPPRRSLARRIEAVPRLALLSGAAVAGMLVNAFFDPTFETPMAAVWLWSMIGIGIGVVVRTRNGEVAAAEGARQG